MSLPLDFIPQKPFPGFKWKWACLQCTEGINDPVVLLGVLVRMRKLERLDRGLTYSSPEFGRELRNLADDIAGRGIGVDLARRTGDRNLIRNSGQYWKALGLIPVDSKGKIELTSFGQQVADAEISQPEFAAITVSTLTLPNPTIQSTAECEQWRHAGISLHPLSLLLEIMRGLRDRDLVACLTKEELIKIIIPLSGTKDVEISDYVSFIKANREGNLDLSAWPDCTPSANDHRIAREFLLFLANYGYVTVENDRDGEVFMYNELIDDEISQILARTGDTSFHGVVNRLKQLKVGAEVERKRILKSQRGRPFQARFRRDVLGEKPRCVISNVTMEEVLIAAHIVPFKYHGADDRTNGFCMRSDIHILYDANELKIRPDGEVELSQRARLSYGASIPPRIVIPEWIDVENIRWRCDNYRGY
jgi:hypothetical protein